MRETTKLLKALSDSNRIRILKMLEVRSLCMCEIAEVLGLAFSTVSKHLSILKDADLLTFNKDGRWVNFTINNLTEKKKVKQMLSLLNTWLNDDKVVIRDREKAAVVNRFEIDTQ